MAIMVSDESILSAIAATIALLSLDLLAAQAGAGCLGLCRLRAPHLRARATIDEMRRLSHRRAGQTNHGAKARLFDG
ncbi:hypothetical protein [Mesorhizobium sp. NZP2077]|uniref:hypothetical protein n=1 Tax=Mesorhizobium sp. NZP2077 TaxID=2483404 RepID=UPI001556673F|nr:hypothetical protein [Mesorhizobium sp. NZP2077]QKD19396.1 hypothetical protein HGP13_32890 [Mesorhizobium sp. NZP2077]